MSAAERCVCCDLPVVSCGKAVEARQAATVRYERERTLARTGWMPAQYPGVCASCGERFDVGEPIARHGSGWRAGCCEGRS